jgi:hypothetical protein
MMGYIAAAVLGAVLGSFHSVEVVLLVALVFGIWILIPYLVFGVWGLSLFGVMLIYAGVKVCSST